MMTSHPESARKHGVLVGSLVISEGNSMDRVLDFQACRVYDRLPSIYHNEAVNDRAQVSESAKMDKQCNSVHATDSHSGNN